MALAGIVVAVGSDCSLAVDNQVLGNWILGNRVLGNWMLSNRVLGNWMLGNRVLGLGTEGWGGYAEEAIVHSYNMRHVPKELLRSGHANGWVSGFHGRRAGGVLSVAVVDDDRRDLRTVDLRGASTGRLDRRSQSAIKS